MTVYCFNCQKLLWDKHTGTQREHMIVENDADVLPDSIFNWYCLPCFRKLPKPVRGRAIRGTTRKQSFDARMKVRGWVR